MQDQLPPGAEHGLVRDILDPEWRDREFIEVDSALEMPRLETTPEPLAPGIWFDVPDEEYHRIPALSNSLCKYLLASPTIAWAESWLNPNREESKADHLVVGKAYHSMILEGVRAYESRFYPMPDKSDFPDALEKIDEIKAAISQRNASPVTRVDAPELGEGKTRAAKKEDWIEQLYSLDRSVEVWELIKAKHERRAKGRELISIDDDHRIRMAARMIKQDPELAKAFEGGWPEVVLIWWDERQGVLCKCKVDYLKLKGMVDLKSFANKRDRSVRNSIIREIAEYRMSLQPAHYLPGAVAVRRLIREIDSEGPIHETGIHHWPLRSDEAAEALSEDDLKAAQARAREQFEWAKRWASFDGNDRWLWVFQQKGDAPVTRGYYHPLGSSHHTIASGMIITAIRQFRECVEIYGVDPWLDLAEIDELGEDDIPAWGLEI